jgi:hypothetical protein
MSSVIMSSVIMPGVVMVCVFMAGMIVIGVLLFGWLLVRGRVDVCFVFLGLFFAFVLVVVRHQGVQVRRFDAQ